MATTFELFDTTQANLINDICTKVAAHADWAETNPTWTTTNLSASHATSVTVFNVVSTAGMFAGQRVRFQVGATSYYRTVVSVNSETSVTINAQLGVATTSANTISTEGRVLRATTTRGAEMIVDLQAGDQASEMYRLNARFWRTLPASYANANPVEALDRAVWWRPSGGTSTQVLHVLLSISKDHLYIGIEGPRSYEAGPANASYGSLRNYLFICDMVPYHAADTIPVVVAHAGHPTVAAASVAAGSFFAFISRDSGDGESWGACRMGTVCFPTVVTADTISLEATSAIDGNRYLFPYVVFSEDEGIRGRLSSLFFAGSNTSTYYNDVSSPSGAKVTHDGIVYRLTSVNLSESATDSWGALGANDNGVAARAGSSVVVAIPFADAV